CRTAWCPPMAPANCPCAISSRRGATICWKPGRIICKERAVLLLDRSFDVSVAAVSPAVLSADDIRGVEQFLFQEVQYLDDRDFDAWLALWDEDGRYWMPRFER